MIGRLFKSLRVRPSIGVCVYSIDFSIMESCSELYYNLKDLRFFPDYVIKSR